MTADAPRVLVIEDEPPIRKFLRLALESHGYRFAEADTATQGLRLAVSEPPDAIVLDLGLPDQDGLEVIQRLREWSCVPILVLSARGQESDKVTALDLGADDYLTKPFGAGELLARLRVALRHAAARGDETASPIFVVGDLRVDFARRETTLAGEEIRLTPTEYRLLTTLARYAGKVVTHRQLLKEVWGPHSIEAHQYLRVYVGQLRRKLERDPTRPRYLKTETGVGYRLMDE